MTFLGYYIEICTHEIGLEPKQHHFGWHLICICLCVAEVANENKKCFISNKKNNDYI